MITLSLDTKEGRIIRELFDKVFENLWKRGSNLSEVCGKCEKKPVCFGSRQNVDTRLNDLGIKELKL